MTYAQEVIQKFGQERDQFEIRYGVEYCDPTNKPATSERADNIHAVGKQRDKVCE